ncbi:uncharacterized protein [Argopecten irradians]|uniref:uncharacterized protein n=1 Tax=Argopecten irradians TaxID=31199 RepID=UPI0037128B0A
MPKKSGDNIKPSTGYGNRKKPAWRPACNQRNIKDTRKKLPLQQNIKTRVKATKAQRIAALKMECRSELPIVDRTEQKNLIGQTRKLIADEQRSAPFIMTKAFKRAKEMLQDKRFVLIRGDSGTGKTRLAAELMACFSSKDQGNMFRCKRPVNLPNFQNWNKICEPDSNLIILLDDVFGYKSSGISEDVTWWKQHADIIKSIGNGEANVANLVIVTVRNDVYSDMKSLFKKLSLVDNENVINISSYEYLIREERKSMLRLYTPTDKFQPFSQDETNDIVDSTSVIGFPECCRLFQLTPELHQYRVQYFKRPLQNIIDVIKDKFSDEKQTTLLYLFLSKKKVSKTCHDFEHSNFDKHGIDNAFKISSQMFEMSKGYINEREQLPCLKQGLRSLCGSFVREENGLYCFFHDSVRDAIAIMYGNETPIGFLRDCPCSCLSYLDVESQIEINNQYRVLIDIENYEALYKRIIDELKLKSHDTYMIVASIQPWQDKHFIQGFFQWIIGNSSVPADFFIQWETEKCIYANQKRIFCNDGFFPKGLCNFLHCVAKTNSVDLMKTLVNMKESSQISLKSVLDVALTEGQDDMCYFLLTKVSEPDIISSFCAAQGGTLSKFKCLRKIFMDQTADETMHILLHACEDGKADLCEDLFKEFSFLIPRVQDDYRYYHVCAMKGHIQCFKIVTEKTLQGLKKKDIDIFIAKTTNENNQTVLHSASVNRNKEMCSFLIKEFPSLLPLRDNHNKHCLHLIAYQGDVECFQAVAALTLSGRDEKEREHFFKTLIDDNNMTVLHLATINGKTEMCCYLMNKYPCLLHHRDNFNMNCLEWIAYQGDVECFETVAGLAIREKNQEKCEQFIKTRTISGQTVLHHASANGKPEMCRYLINTYPSLLHLRDHFNIHCLHMIALKGNVECFKTVFSIVQHNKDIEECKYYIERLTDVFGNTVLHSAVSNKDMCCYLIKEFPSLLHVRNNNNMHCLHSICIGVDFENIISILDGMDEKEHHHLIKIMTKIASYIALEKGKADICFNGNELSLIFATFNEHMHCLRGMGYKGGVECFESVAALTLNGRDEIEKEQFIATLKDNDDRTVLHSASSCGNTGLCCYLVKKYPSLLPLRDNNNMHCLHLIAYQGDVECFKSVAALTLHGKDVKESEHFIKNLKDKYDKTVLHIASEKGKTEMCCYLIKEFPSLLPLRDNNNMHCLHLIAYQGDVECFQSVATLTLHGKDEKNVNILSKR